MERMKTLVSMTKPPRSREQRGPRRRSWERFTVKGIGTRDRADGLPPQTLLRNRGHCCCFFVFFVFFTIFAERGSSFAFAAVSMSSIEVFSTPGEVLGSLAVYAPGPGTYAWGGNVVSSVVGLQRVVPPSPDAPDQRPIIEVSREKEQGAVPGPGAQVTAKIRKVQPRQAIADILCVGTRAVKEKFRGLVRQQDVRATEIDKVDMHLSFRPGDIIRAEVLSLGDARAYFLSTAKNELGVVSATSDAGAQMVPISWQEMQCPVTFQKEFRKVAKVV